MVAMEKTTPAMKTTQVFNDAADKNVAKNVVYANPSNTIFYDKEFKNEVPAEDCLNLFMKGVVALKAGTYYAAVSCTDAGVINFGL